MTTRILLCFLVLLAAVPASAADAVIVPLCGEVSEAQFFFLRRALKEAEKRGAKAIILDMDTYGGALSAAVKMQDALTKTSLRTATFVNQNAGSAGALIAVSTKEIYMAPVSAIGAAAPVMGSGQEMPETMTDKTVSYFSGYFRSAAERNGHNPDIAEAFINKAKEVKIGEEVIHRGGSILTLSAQEATRWVNGKPLLALGTADSAETALKAMGIAKGVERIEPTGFEQVAFWLTMLAPVFLLGGIVGGYIEFKTPGFGIPGAVSIACFILFFTGHYVAGLAGMEVLALFGLGLVLIAVELFFFPGLIVPGLVGTMLVLGTLFFAMVDRYPSQPFIPEVGGLIAPAANMAIAGVLGVIAIMLLGRFLPKTPLYHALVLETAQPHGPSLGNAPESAVRAGDTGVTTSILRPSGRVEVRGVAVDAVSQGDFIEPGTPVRVLAVEGGRVVVEPVRVSG